MTGTYVLVIDVPRELSIEVGALGETTFVSGASAYVGSAFGPGGFARIERHRELAAGDRETRHWHVDYLLGHPETSLEAVLTYPGADRECELAGRLPGEPVAAFGASDCSCRAHLRAGSSSQRVVEAARELGGQPAEGCD